MDIFAYVLTDLLLKTAPTPQPQRAPHLLLYWARSQSTRLRLSRPRRDIVVLRRNVVGNCAIWFACSLSKIVAFKKRIVNITQMIRVAVMHEWLVEFGKASSHNCCSVLSPSPRERSAPQNNLKVTAGSLVPKHSDDIFVNWCSLAFCMFSLKPAKSLKWQKLRQLWSQKSRNWTQQMMGKDGCLRSVLVSILCLATDFRILR